MAYYINKLKKELEKPIGTLMTMDGSPHHNVASKFSSYPVEVSGMKLVRTYSDGNIVWLLKNGSGEGTTLKSGLEKKLEQLFKRDILK